MALDIVSSVVFGLLFLFIFVYLLLLFLYRVEKKEELIDETTFAVNVSEETRM